MRNALHPPGSGAYDANDLFAELRQIDRGIAPGVVEIPAAGMEHMAAELRHPRNAGQLGAVKRAVSHGHILGAKAIAAVGGDNPAPRRLVPGKAGYRGTQQGVVVQLELLRDSPRVLADLLAPGVLPRGHVARFL